MAADHEKSGLDVFIFQYIKELMGGPAGIRAVVKSQCYAMGVPLLHGCVGLLCSLGNDLNAAGQDENQYYKYDLVPVYGKIKFHKLFCRDKQPYFTAFIILKKRRH